MPTQNAEAIRPSSIFRAWDTTWKVLENDTLNRTLTIRSIDANTHKTKKIRYQPGQEIFLRWSPTNRK